jgi:hypothetical protein
LSSHPLSIKQKLEYTKYNFPYGFVWVWNFISDTDWGFLRTGCWGEEYLDQREMKWQEVGENWMSSSFVTCTLCQIYLERLSQGGWDGQGM